MENMLVVELQKNVGCEIVFWLNNLRFEGKNLGCDGTFLKYYDSRKLIERFVRVSEIENCEVRQ